MMQLLINEGRAVLAEAAKTYPVAQREILDYLKSKRWEVKDKLKIPLAVSPDKDIALWFKKQAVWGHDMDGYKEKPQFPAARSLHIADLRQLDGPSFVKNVERWFKK
jgi:hypothetical protein